MCGCEPGFVCTRCAGYFQTDPRMDWDEDSGFDLRCRENDERSRHDIHTPWREATFNG